MFKCKCKSNEKISFNLVLPPTINIRGKYAIADSGHTIHRISNKDPHNKIYIQFKSTIRKRRKHIPNSITKIHCPESVP